MIIIRMRMVRVTHIIIKAHPFLALLVASSRIDAFALLAVVLLHLSACDSFGAAIAAIVATVFVVVLIIAVAVSPVIRQLADQFAFALVVWVDALARFAEVF